MGRQSVTVVATSGVVVPETLTGTLPPIGQAISGLQIHILDEEMRPVAENTAGQIYIGGPAWLAAT